MEDMLSHSCVQCLTFTDMKCHVNQHPASNSILRKGARARNFTVTIGTTGCQVLGAGTHSRVMFKVRVMFSFKVMRIKVIVMV